MPNIQENITRIQGAKSSLKTSIQNKGVTIPDDALIDTYYTYVDQIQTGSSSGSGDYDSTMEDKHFTVNNNNGWPNSMTSATISDGITSLPDSAFSQSQIAEITIPNSVTSFGNYCFSRTNSLSSITIPNSVTSFGNYCFSQTNSLSSITIPNSVTSLGDYCFFNCLSLSSITIPSGVTSLSDCCFNSCQALSSITIPDSVTSIGYNCFEYCTSLSSITIPTGVTSLRDACFSSCFSLSSITIPSGVTSIGYNCFYACLSLSSITCLPTTPPTSGSNMFADTNNCPIYVPNESVEAYKSAWSTYADRIFPINPEPIPTGSTENADIDVVYDVTSTTEETELICSGDSIEYFTIDDNNTAYEPTTFYGHTFDTTGYHTVHYYLTGNTIGESIFATCDRIKTATVGSGVTILESNVFYDCTGLTSAIIPDSVTEMGICVFDQCSSLSSVTLPSNLSILNYKTFSGCTSLKTLTIPNTVTSIGNSCFERCSGLTTIDIPDSVTSLGDDCFKGCMSLTSITIPTGITEVPSGYVSGCSSLSSITIPENITYIGSSAFRYCSSLQWIDCLPTTPPGMASSFVLDETNNCPIYVPDDSVTAYKTASGWSTYDSKIQPLSSKPE